MVLNDQAVRSAKAGIVWDSSLKGFGLRVGKQSKTFIVLVGSGRRKRIGRYPLISLAQAREAARKILAEKTLGKIVPTHTAYEDACEEFLKDCAGRLRPKTVAHYKWNLSKFFRFGRQGVGDVTTQQILRGLKDLTPSNKEHAFRVGRTFFTWCANLLIKQSRSGLQRFHPSAMKPCSSAKKNKRNDTNQAKLPYCG